MERNGSKESYSKSQIYKIFIYFFISFYLFLMIINPSKALADSQCMQGFDSNGKTTVECTSLPNTPVAALPYFSNPSSISTTNTLNFSGNLSPQGGSENAKTNFFHPGNNVGDACRLKNPSAGNSVDKSIEYLPRFLGVRHGVLNPANYCVPLNTTIQKFVTLLTDFLFIFFICIFLKPLRFFRKR